MRSEPEVLVDVRDTSALVDALSQVFLFAEHVNALASLHIGRSFGDTRAERLKLSRHIPGILLWLRDRMSRTQARWFVGSDVLDLASQLDVQPTPNPEIIGELVRLLLRPARVGPERGSSNWKIDSGPLPLYLPRPLSAESAERLSERISFYLLPEGTAFANRPLQGNAAAYVQSLAVRYWEEPFDSINVVRLFLSEILRERGRAADQYLQRWICEQFGLVYDRDTKYSLAEICKRLNVLFYESAVPETQTIHTKRAATLSTTLLISEIARLLPDSDVSRDKPALRRRQAFGLYLFLRFCRQLRCGYCWFDRQRLKGAEDSELRVDLVDGCHFSSALRPFGYTYLQSRVFGAISIVPGLSNIFRGGLLPRVDSGRTLALIGPPGVGKTVLALQILADVAGMGGLAVYFSFEESYGSIVDRLITFGLYRPEKFQIEAAGSNIHEVLRDVSEDRLGKGILVLYGRDAPFSLLEALESISHAAKETRFQRALVLDSINALNFSLEAVDEQGTGRRVELGALVDMIEGNNFLGVLLAEKDDRSLWTLPYLMDTVIELGIDDSTHLRWLEIKKCRVQDYHPGRHPFRMSDSLGITIYPSLGARRSSLRGRVRSTSSEQRYIPFPQSWQEAFGLEGIREKSSTLIWGPPGGGKTLLLLNLLTEHTLKRSRLTEEGQDVRNLDLGPPANVLVITFRTPEKIYFQTLERHRILYARWQHFKQVRMRWYSVGVNFSAEQMISEIWRYFNSSRREGLPVDRVVFDETESAEDFLPALRNEPLFWPTLFELTSTEAVNSFFVCSRTGVEPRLMKLLRPSMDYVLHAFEGGSGSQSKSATSSSKVQGPARRWVAIEKHPDIVPGDRKMLVPLRVHGQGESEGLVY